MSVIHHLGPSLGPATVRRRELVPNIPKKNTYRAEVESGIRNRTYFIVKGIKELKGGV